MIKGYAILLPWSLAAQLACSSRTAAPSDPQVLARVGGEEITAQELDRALEVLYPLGDPHPDRGAERKALGRLIETELLVLAAKAKGLEHDWQVKDKVQQKEQELLLEELYRRNILKIPAVVSSEEARGYFGRSGIGEERRLSRILVSSPAAARRARERLEAGEDFASLASEVSGDGKTAAKGGDLGWVNRLSLRSHLLRRQVFEAAVGEVIGPFQEPTGYSLVKVTDVRQVPFEQMAASVEKAIVEQKRSLATLKYLEDLAERAGVREDGETLQLLLARLSEADTSMPELKKEEGGKVLLTTGGMEWTLDHFMAAMLSERDQAEIRSLEDLRLYARRLFALKVLLPRHAEELGIRATEYVQKNLNTVLREALMDRLRQVEVDEKVDPSEEEMRLYYEKYRDRYVLSERITILEVLMENRESAEELLKEVERGKDLAELATRYSMRSSRIRRAGGRIQLMHPDKYGRMGWEAREAKVGEVVGPVKSFQGYSVFKVLKKIPARQQSFEEAKGRIRAHMRQEIIVQGVDTLLRKLSEKHRSQVEIYEDHLRVYLEPQRRPRGSI